MSIYHNRLLKTALPVFIQNVSAHRKPRWLPVAKSKIYRIPKRPVVPPEEKIELKRITDNYHTQIRALRKYFINEVNNEKLTLDDTSSEMSLNQEAKEWEQCVALNDKWNAQIAAEREVRRQKEIEDIEEKSLLLMEAKEKEAKEKMLAVDAEIRQLKELSATFITPESLDAAIDHAIDNPVDYNFAIDLKGNRTVGTDTPVTPPKQSIESDRAESRNT